MTTTLPQVGRLCLRGSVGRCSSALKRDAAMRFRSDRWEGRYATVCARAFAEVPFYREQWARAARELAEPVAVSAGQLGDELFRLCPLRAPWDPSREPTLWSGELGVLADALTAAGVPPRRVPVLEVRRSANDRTSFGPGRAPYGFLLSIDADVAGAGRRLALALGSLKLAVEHGRAVVVVEPHEHASILREVDAWLAPVSVGWRHVRRLTLADAAAVERWDATPTVVHDPFLGYVAARQPDCGEIHLLWDRIYAKQSSAGLVFTDLRRRRPTLVNVLPVKPGFAAVRSCPVHGTPVLVN